MSNLVSSRIYFSLVTLSEILVTITWHKTLVEVLFQMEYLVLKPFIWLMLLQSPALSFPVLEEVFP